MPQGTKQADTGAAEGLRSEVWHTPGWAGRWRPCCGIIVYLKERAWKGKAWL